MNIVQNLLNEITQELKALDTAKKLYSEQLAPSFSVFDYIKTDELGISKIIADLLNPQGSHSQKSLFLDTFMQVCLSNLYQQGSGNWQNFASDKVLVNIEEPTKHGRRMDIYLTNADKTHGICIENKPYAHDQKNQMTDYSNELLERHPDNYHLIYLAEYGEPSVDSVDKETYQKWQKEKRVTWLKFSDLIPWLITCKAECQNASVVEFINQFIKFIQMEFMGVQDMSEEKTTVEMMLKDTNSISSSIAINKNIVTMKTTLMDKLVSELKSGLQTEKNYIYEKSQLNYHSRWDNSDITFLIEKSELQIHFQFDRTNYTNPMICVRIGEDNTIADVSRCQSINEILKKHYNNIQSNKFWCAWYNFEPFDWCRSSEPWEMIHTGEMAKKIIDEVEELYQVLSTHDLLD